TGREEGLLIHFLSDQQWCLHWHLYINASGEHCVIVSKKAYGIRIGEEARQPSRLLRAIHLEREPVWFCAPSFAQSIYRLWLENEILYALADKRQPLTTRQQAYLAPYKKSPD